MSVSSIDRFAHRFLRLAVFLIVVGSSMEAYAQRDSSARKRERDARKIPSKQSDEKLFSGPQAGEELGDVPVWVIEPEDAPTTKKDLRELSKKSPIAIAFMHEKSRPAFAMARLMSTYAEKLKDKNLQIYFVVLTEDRSQSETWLRQIRRYFQSPTQLAVADGGIEGPGSLGLNRLVAMTILVAKSEKVTSNFAFKNVSTEVDGPKVLKAMSDVVDGGKVPAIKDLMPARRR